MIIIIQYLIHNGIEIELMPLNKPKYFLLQLNKCHMLNQQTNKLIYYGQNIYNNKNFN